MPTPPLVHVLDDDPAVCRSLGSLIERLGCPWREHSCCEQFLAGYDPRQSACLVLDIMLPDMSGLELLGELGRRGALLPTLVLSADPTIERVVTAMQRGAISFLAKPPAPAQFFDQFNLLREKASVMAQQRCREIELREAEQSLTPREREVLGQLLDGRSVKQIAHQLTLSPRTAHIHRANVLRKFRVETVVELHRLLANTRGPAG